MSVFVCALLETGGAQINNYTSPLQKLWPRHLLELSPPAPSLQQGARKLWLPQQAVRLEAYMHQLFLRVVLLGAVLPVAVGLIDDHLGLLLAVIPVQVFLEVSQLLLGEEQSTPMVSRGQPPAPDEKSPRAPGSLW